MTLLNQPEDGAIHSQARIGHVHLKVAELERAIAFYGNLALIGLLLPTVIAGPGEFAIGRLLPLPKAAGTDRPILFLE